MQGRFISIDPAGSDPLKPQTFNKYQYAQNNPLCKVDSSGTYEEDVHKDLTTILARKAVERFYLHFSRREYDQIWGMLSDATKDGNDYNKARYINELSRTDSFRLSIEIKNVKITADRATVTLVRRGRIDANSKFFSETHEETWISQRGRWLFDNSRMLNEEPEALSQPW